MSNFLIHINCIIISFDKNQSGQSHILSLDKNQIVFPKFILTQDYFDTPEYIVSFLKNFIVLNPIYLIPQLLDFKQITNKRDTVDLIYGFFVEYTNNINNSYWISIDSIGDSDYYTTIYETIQKLQ